MRISLRSAFVSFAALAVIACTDAAYSAMLAQDTAQGASQNAPQSAPAVAAAPEARAPIDAAWIGAWIGEASTPRLNGRAPIALPIIEPPWPNDGWAGCVGGMRKVLFG